MPGPPPKAASKRQRRNRTTTAATLEAPPVSRPDLPALQSPDVCAAAVDRKSGCPLAQDEHNLGNFAKASIEIHAFIPAVIPWHEMTIRWWQTIWSSPMVAEWVDADVPGLFALAMLWDRYHRSGDARIHGEARLASREFGLTPLSRRGLQWEVKRVEGTKPKPTAPRAPRRRARAAVLTALDGGLSKRKASGA